MERNDEAADTDGRSEHRHQELVHRHYPMLFAGTSSSSSKTAWFKSLHKHGSNLDEEKSVEEDDCDDEEKIDD